jgi:hypothetical protein
MGDAGQPSAEALDIAGHDLSDNLLQLGQFA